MSSLCSLCSSLPLFDLPPFPPWLKAYHVPIDPLSDFVPFLPSIEALEEDAEGTQGSHKVKPDLAPGLPYHQSLEQLSAGATKCDLCKIIEDSVLKVKLIWDEAQENSLFTYYDRSGPPSYKLFLSAPREQQSGFVVLSVSEKRKTVFLLAGIGFCAEDDSPLKAHFRGHTITTDPSSPINFERYRQWLHQCEHDHHECSAKSIERPANMIWPLRLLDIGSEAPLSDWIRLIESPPVEVKYATLSHCWGSSLHFTLTHATLESHKRGISLLDLPKTFQDAVLVARELNLPYIWIDSLCICQDDHADWERESAKMASIYSNAHISIASASAGSDAAGFLNPRLPREYVTIPTTVHDNSPQAPLRGELKLFSIPAHLAANGDHYLEMQHLPLSTRAWALQERYLSRRMFHFGESQAFYECATCFVSEDGFYTQNLRFDFNNAKNAKPRRKGHLGQGPEYHFRMGPRWYETLRQYSARNLSRDSDKLPALTGLARAYEDLMGGDYVAGLWKADLVEGLAFQCYGQPNTRPKQWRAPTWSWASVDGPIAVTDLGGSDDLVEVRDVKVEVKGMNPYGEVKSAELYLACVLEKLTVSAEPEHDAANAPPARNARVCFDQDDAYGYYVSLDVEDAKAGVRDMELYGIPLTKSSEKSSAYVLLVVPDRGANGTYRREGCCLLGSETLTTRWKKAKESGKLMNVVLI